MFDGYTTVYNERTGRTEVLSKAGLLNLANAVIANACKTYMNSNSIAVTDGIEHFLLSGYGRALLLTIEPEGLISKMQEVKASGKK